MSEFRMAVHEPAKVQFELSVVLSLADWKKVAEQLHGAPLYGPADQMKDAIQEMVKKANADYRAWPQLKEEA